MVSVIVPVYNSQNVLSDTIESVLAQTYVDFELLLVDDGSTDTSPQICDEYARKDKRIKVFHKQNGGVSSARNYGLENAKGEFISFLDNDDMYYPEFLQTMIDNIGNYDYLLASYIEKGISERKHPESVQRKKTVKQKIEAKNIKEIHDKAQELNLLGFGAIWCTLFRKSIIDKYHIRFQHLQYEDTIFIYEYALHCNSMCSISYEGYFCYNHNDSQGHSHKYIAEEKAVSELDGIFNDVLQRFSIKDSKSVSKFRNRLRFAIRSYLLKGYYIDTRVTVGKRISRWNFIRNKHFLCKPYRGGKDKLDSFFYIVVIFRLYYIIDPLLILLMNRVFNKKSK